jgi:hypothetical protein
MRGVHDDAAADLMVYHVKMPLSCYTTEAAGGRQFR